MVRISAALFCSILISSAALAFPKAGAGEHSLLIRVEEGFPSPEFSEYRSGGTAGDCRLQDPANASAECASYWQRVERSRERRAAALEKARDAAFARQASRKAASRALSEHERNAAAPRPVVPARASMPIKPVAGKTLEERVRRMAGQLFMTGFSGRIASDTDVERVSRELREDNLSGVIVRDSNIASSGQLRQLLSAINDAGGESPPLIAIEQPGGPDSVLSEDKGFAFYYSANGLSSAANPYEAQIVYRAMAGELAALGVSLNIGPSEDACLEDGVNLSAPCFGRSPPVIASYARAFNFGHHDRGVLTALRHVPFRTGLRTSWLSERPGPAMLHSIVKGETSDALVVSVKVAQPLPLTDISLNAPRAGRPRRFGYRGALVFELDVGSAGAPRAYGEAVVRSLQAGADLILVREPSALPANFFALSTDAIQVALKSRRLQLARLEDAYRHVQVLKARLKAFPARMQVAGLNRAPLPGH
jgi:Glycosyl hydrolase family 3 N terminal domain